MYYIFLILNFLIMRDNKVCGDLLNGNVFKIFFC